jgi:hypothetical protein
MSVLIRLGYQTSSLLMAKLQPQMRRQPNQLHCLLESPLTQPFFPSNQNVIVMIDTVFKIYRLYPIEALSFYTSKIDKSVIEELFSLLFLSLLLHSTLPHNIKERGYGYTTTRTWPYIWFYCSKGVGAFGMIFVGKSWIETRYPRNIQLTERSSVPSNSSSFASNLLVSQLSDSHIVCPVLIEKGPLNLLLLLYACFCLAYSSILQATCSSETSVHLYWITRPYIP